MKLLLDTHIFIWCVDDDPKLSAAAWSMTAEGSRRPNDSRRWARRRWKASSCNTA